MNNWRKFEAFLKREGVYEKYMKNLLQQGGQIDAFEYPSEYVNAAFSWAGTDEGHSLWIDIDIKWGEELTNVKTEINKAARHEGIS